MLRLLLCTALLAGVTSIHGQTADELIESGIKLHDEGKFEEAIAAFQDALRADPDDQGAHYELANTYFALKRFDRCIEQADIVIASKVKLARQAYDLKGSALDMTGHPKDAIKTYEKGIKEFPDFYLLRYNLGLTYFTEKDFKDAEKSLQGALGIKATHPGSHYILGHCMREQGARARALLCFYHLLLLEQEGKRAEVALDMLDKLLQQGVQRTGEQSISVSVPAGGKDDDFMAAEMAVSLQQAMHITGGDSLRTEMEHFIEQTRSLFTIIGELRRNEPAKNKGFWWDFYGRFYYDLAQSPHLKAFCYLVRIPSKDAEVQEWVGLHGSEIDALFAWCNEQDRSF